MKLYIIIIAFSVLIMDFINILVLNLTWNYVVLFSVLGVLVAFIIDLILAIIIRKLPEKCFNPSKKVFKIFAFEKKLYEALGVKKFKDKVPELGKYSGFSKSQVVDPKNPEYLYRFMLECCYGEVIHLISVPIGILVIFCMPKALWISIGFPIVIVNGILCLLPFFVLRYNRKKLQNLYKFSLKKRKQKEEILA